MSHSANSPDPATGEQPAVAPGARREPRVRRGRAARRLDLTAVVAVVLVALTAGALLLTRPDGWSQPTAAAREATVRSATLVCPTALAGEDAVGVATTATQGGEVGVAGDGAQAGSVTLAPGGAAAVRARQGSLVLSASGAAADGLVAGRSSRRPLSATDCAPPAADEWFTGLGAGPVHNSSIVLTNPNKGSGVVDVTVIDKSGVVNVPGLRGVAVPGGSTRTIDLASLMPQGGSLAIHAVVVRGQVGIAVRDRAGELTGDAHSEEWLGGETVPSPTSLLLGYPSHASARSLVVANPGQDQVTATVKLVTPDSVLAPAGSPTIQVPPDTVATVSLEDLMSKPVADGAYGIEVDASGPVTATLRSVAAGDLATTVPAAPLSGASALVLPAGRGVASKTVALAGSSGVGAATVISRDADGKQLASKRVALEQQQGDTVDVPAGAVVVEVRPEGVSVSAAILVAGHGRDGAAVIPFRPQSTSAQVPAVAPGLR